MVISPLQGREAEIVGFVVGVVGVVGVVVVATQVKVCVIVTLWLCYWT